MKSLLLSFSLVLLVSGYAFAHPGRLDEKNCHRVTEDWKYKSGKILKAGTYHCHGKLNDMLLDGRNILEDPNDKGEPARSPKKEKRK